MALFSRRRKDEAAPSAAPAAPAAPSAAEPEGDAPRDEAPRDEAPRDEATGDEAPRDQAPADNAREPDTATIAPVGISISTFQGVGAASPPVTERSTPPTAAPTPAHAQVPAEAPDASETVPGLRDNVLLRDAVRNLPASPTATQVFAAARQLLQGHAFLRVKGDARTLLSQGADLPLAVITTGDQQFMLVYSSGDALQRSLRADGDTATSAMGQPVLSVLQNALRGGYAGIVLDHGSAASPVILPREMVQRIVDDADPELRIKSTLAGPRTAQTASDVVSAMLDVPVWIAANRAAESDRLGIAESRTPDGGRFIEVFSHPLEAVALGRGDRPVRVTATQLGAALASDEGLSGAVVDPAGPWIRLSRADLAPVLALAPAS